METVAIVTNESGVETFTNKFNFVLPGKMKGFKLSEIDAAKKWVVGE